MVVTADTELSRRNQLINYTNRMLKGATKRAAAHAARAVDCSIIQLDFASIEFN